MKSNKRKKNTVSSTNSQSSSASVKENQIPCVEISESGSQTDSLEVKYQTHTSESEIRHCETHDHETACSQTSLDIESRTQHSHVRQKKSETIQVKETLTDNENATQARQRESTRLDHDNGIRKEKLNVENPHASLTQKKGENQTADNDEIQGQTELPPATTCIKTDEQMEK